MTERWRVGRKVGRTIYIHPDYGPDGDGRLVGLMDTPELAELVVRAVNAHLADEDARAWMQAQLASLGLTFHELATLSQTGFQTEAQRRAWFVIRDWERLA